MRKNDFKDADLGNIRFYKDDAEKEFFYVITRNKGKKNILFLDPPRTAAKRWFFRGNINL